MSDRSLLKESLQLFADDADDPSVSFVAEEIPIADSAMLVLVNNQMDGYAYIPGQ